MSIHFLSLSNIFSSTLPSITQILRTKIHLRFCLSFLSISKTSLLPACSSKSKTTTQANCPLQRQTSQFCLSMHLSPHLPHSVLHFHTTPLCFSPSHPPLFAFSPFLRPPQKSSHSPSFRTSYSPTFLFWSSFLTIIHAALQHRRHPPFFPSLM